MLVIANDVVQAPNDKQQLEPMLAKACALPEELGKVETMLADNGYFSEANVNACEAAGIEPLLAMGWDSHHPSLLERFAGAPPAPENPTPVEAMAHRLQTPEGKNATLFKPAAVKRPPDVQKTLGIARAAKPP